jgi:hypothetical protein
MRRATIERNLNRWGDRALLIAAVMMIVIFLEFAVAIYWGDEYASPSWNDASVPASRPY